ncbi:MAG: hypothetical protein HGA45_03820 [Chloroflexales bacterium]|nr:hypothetical protein [Chloroflexales bacterium]
MQSRDLARRLSLALLLAVSLAACASSQPALVPTAAPDSAPSAVPADTAPQATSPSLPQEATAPSVATAPTADATAASGCAAVEQLDPTTAEAQAIGAAFLRGLPSDRSLGQIDQLHSVARLGEWLILEASFTQGEPGVIVLRQQGGDYREVASWSGIVTEANQMQSYLRAKAPGAPAALFTCFTPKLTHFTFPAPGAPAAPAAEPSAPVYVDQGKLIARHGLDDLTQLASLPEGVLGAVLADQATLLLVRERSVERVRIPDGAPEPVAALDQPALWGAFVPAGPGRLLYAVAVSEPERVSPFGRGTRIGSYDLATGEARQILAAPEALELLGITADGQGMLVLPRGQDPAFGTIQIRSLADGQLIESLPVQGEGFAAVSPDGRWAAVSSRRILDAQGNAADELLLYDLTARPPSVRVVALPNPGAATGGLWAPDGSRFYFGYGPGNIYALEGSYGLWALDPQTLAVTQAADVSVKDTRLDGISPSGTIMVRSVMGDEAALVSTASGGVTPSILPPSALMAGWR